MSEMISVVSLDNPVLPYPMDRDEFYKEQLERYKKGEKPNKAAAIFDVILFTENKEVILQKRSRNKQHNAGLIDKTIGGHIQHGDSPYYTAMIESVQELRIPAAVLQQDEDFKRTFGVLKNSLESIAVMKLIDNGIHTIENVYQGERVPIAKNIWMFLGIYGGAIKPVDREATGVFYYELDILRQEMKEMPMIFTPDFHFMVEHYRHDMDEFLAQF